MVLDIRDPIQLGPPIKNKAITDHFEPRQKLGEAKTIKKVFRSKKKNFLGQSLLS